MCLLKPYKSYCRLDYLYISYHFLYLFSYIGHTCSCLTDSSFMYLYILCPLLNKILYVIITCLLKPYKENIIVTWIAYTLTTFYIYSATYYTSSRLTNSSFRCLYIWYPLLNKIIYVIFACLLKPYKGNIIVTWINYTLTIFYIYSATYHTSSCLVESSFRSLYIWWPLAHACTLSMFYQSVF